MFRNRVTIIDLLPVVLHAQGTPELTAPSSTRMEAAAIGLALLNKLRKSTSPWCGTKDRRELTNWLSLS